MAAAVAQPGTSYKVLFAISGMFRARSERSPFRDRNGCSPALGSVKQVK
jgi:hypothetical protein